MHYEEYFRVLICKEHKHAIQNLDEHLRKHHSIDSKARRQVVQRYSSLALLEPQDVPLPEPLRQPFEALGKPIRALICEEEECEYITINRSVIGQHCNKTHKWKSTRGQQEYWHDIWVQSFFGSRRQRYFSVLWSEEENGQNTTGLDALDKIEVDIIQDE